MSEERFEPSGTKERNLAMELVRVTEAAALSAARWMGRGDKEKIDQVAVDAMRQALDGVDMHGIVVIGEGEKDEAPMLYIGEELGNGTPPEVDVAVDPVDGTRLTSLGLPGAIAVVATAERGTMYSAPPGIFYMEKIAVGPVAIGGAPEAVLAAAAIKCVGGAIQCKIWPRSDEERANFKADGIDLDKVLQTDDLVRGHDVSFAATGITSGELLKGVQYFGWGARTFSVMMRAHSGTVRYIEARHKWRKAQQGLGIPRIN